MSQEPTNQDTERALSHLQAVGGGAKKATHPQPEEKEAEAHPMVKLARSYGQDLRITAEVAQELNVSRELVRRWARQGRCNAPTYRAPLGDGEIEMALYTPEDIDRLKAYRNRQRRLIRQEYPNETNRVAS